MNDQTTSQQHGQQLAELLLDHPAAYDVLMRSVELRQAKAAGVAAPSGVVFGAKLGSLLEGSPLAKEALERSLAKKEEKRIEAEQKEKAKSVALGVCPFCGKTGKTYTVAGRAYTAKPTECCQRAAAATAAKMLAYFYMPTAKADKEQEQAGLEYARLRHKITVPSLLEQLDKEEANYARIEERVTVTSYRPSAPPPLRIDYQSQATD